MGRGRGRKGVRRRWYVAGGVAVGRGMGGTGRLGCCYLVAAIPVVTTSKLPPPRPTE